MVNQPVFPPSLLFHKYFVSFDVYIMITDMYLPFNDSQTPIKTRVLCVCNIIVLQICLCVCVCDGGLRCYVYERNE